MKKAILGLVFLFCALNFASAQKYNLDVLILSPGMLKLAASADPAKETNFYFNSVKDEVVNSKTDGDLYAKVFATKDSVKLRLYYIASDRRALFYDLVKQGNQFRINNVVWMTTGGFLLVQGKNLSSGKGYVEENYEGYTLLNLYRDGKKQDIDYFVESDANNLFFVRARYEGKMCYGVLHSNGDVMIPVIYQSLKKNTDGYTAVNLDGKMGIFNREGKEIIPCKFYKIEKINDNLYEVSVEHMKDGSKDWTYGLYDLKGNMISPPITPFISFKEGLAAIGKEEGKFGYINESGKFVIPAQYKSARPFSDGLALVENEQGLFGYIDKTGSLIIPFKYTSGFDFYDGKVSVTEDAKKKKYFRIDKRGNKVK